MWPPYDSAWLGRSMALAEPSLQEASPALFPVQPPRLVPRQQQGTLGKLVLLAGMALTALLIVSFAVALGKQTVRLFQSQACLPQAQRLERQAGLHHQALLEHTGQNSAHLLEKLARERLDFAGSDEVVVRLSAAR